MIYTKKHFKTELLLLVGATLLISVTVSLTAEAHLITIDNLPEASLTHAVEGDEKMNPEEKLKKALKEAVSEELDRREYQKNRLKTSTIDISGMGASCRPNKDEPLPEASKIFNLIYRSNAGDSSASDELRRMGVEVGKELQEDDDTEGGYLVPIEHYSDLLWLPQTAYLETFCRTIDMDSKSINYPDLTTSISASFTSEEATISESEPVLGQVTLTATKLGCRFTASNELLQDSKPSVMEWMREQFAEANAIAMENQILNGTGSPCSGIMTANAGFSVVMSTGETNFSDITPTHLSEMISKVPASILPGCRFVMHKSTFHHIRTLKDDNGNYIYSPVGGAQSGTVWNYPVYLSDSAPSTSGADTPFVSFGNFRYFLIGNRKEMAIDMNPYSKFNTYQTDVRSIRRVALKIGKANAFCRLLTSAS